MDKESELSDALIQFGKTFTRASVITEGKIKDVDEIAFTATITISVSVNGKDIDTDLPSVPLKVLKGSQASFIEIPSVGSACTICFKNNNIQRPQIFQIDTCDKILIKVGENNLEINPEDGFVFNNSSNGIVLITELITKLNNIETDLNNLKNLMFAWIPVPSDGGLALKTAAIPWINNKLVKTIKSDIENTKVKA